MNTFTFKSLLKFFEEKILGNIDWTFLKGECFDRVKVIFPFFYYFLFLTSFLRLEGLNYVIEQWSSGFFPYGPLGWASSLEYGSVVTFVFIGSTLGALAASFFPFSRIARVMAFLLFFQYHAYLNSFGGPNHQWDLWLWTAFIFIFFPSIKRGVITLEKKEKFSLVFWTAGAFILLTYTMAAIGKISYGVLQFSNGQANLLSLDSAALHISTILLQMQEVTPLGPFLVENFLIGFFLFLIVVYLQFFSFFVAFRPQLYRVWGLALVLFHLGTFLSMRAVFVVPSALLLLFFFSSPFAPGKTSPKEILTSLPLLSFFKNRSTTL